MNTYIIFRKRQIDSQYNYSYIHVELATVSTTDILLVASAMGDRLGEPILRGDWVGQFHGGLVLAASYIGGGWGDPVT